MKRSESKILTTHVGALPDLIGLDTSAADYEDKLREAVAAVLRRQRETGLDLVNEGEYAKGGDWLSYLEDRFGGFEPQPPGTFSAITSQGRDREEFADFYREAAARGTLYYVPLGGDQRRTRPNWRCTGPIVYRGLAALQREIDVLRSLTSPEDVFLTATAPASIEVYRQNDFYKSEEEFVFALAEAMRTEYEAIVEAGFLLQVDDAWLVAQWDRIGIQMGLEAFRKRMHAPGRGAQPRLGEHPGGAAFATTCAGAAGTGRTRMILRWSMSWTSC